MSAHSVLTIRLVGGHPALDLLNTVDLDRPPKDQDVLRCFRDDTFWAVRVGLLSSSDREFLLDMGERSPSRARQAHVELLHAREALRLVVRAEVDGAAVNPVAAKDFEQAVAAALAHRRFSIFGSPPGWRWLADDIDAVQHRAILGAADLLADPARRPITVCAGTDCGWFFLDTSRSGKRRWCSDAGCGTASRVRRLRRKRAAES